MRAVMYLRQSKDPNDDQLAISRQREDCVALCEARGWTWTEYVDNDRSASNGTRPAYQRMLDDIRAGLIDAVVAWDLDRLYRQPRELEDLIDLADQKHLALATVGGEADLSTDNGRLFARIKGAVARGEMERKSTRQKRATRQRRESGAWNKAGQRPFGYTKAGVPLEPEASMLRKAITDLLAGTSLRSISIDWNRRGVTTTRGSTWSNLQLRRVLLNPLYAGLVTHQHKIVGPGEWEPLIDEETHRGLTAFLNDPSRRPAVSFERRHMGSGVYRCGKCGSRLYAAYPHGPGRKMLYLCKPTAHIARQGAPLDAFIEALVLEYLSANGIGAGLRESESQVDLGALRTRRAALQARLDDLAAMFAAGEIDGSQLRRGSTDLRQQVAGIDSVLAEAARVSPVAVLMDGEDDIDEQMLIDRWTAASLDIKGKIVAELMDVTVMPGRRGMRPFDPSLIEINWRRGPSAGP
jgi:DNA invertase Pin-like site-specific DNA recombinase